jgi:hypothetical protein
MWRVGIVSYRESGWTFSFYDECDIIHEWCGPGFERATLAKQYMRELIKALNGEK